MIRLSAMVLFSFATLLLTAADRVKAGQWESTMTMAAGKPMVTKYCITDADARMMNGDLATLRKYLVDSTAKNTGGRCTVKSLELRDNHTTIAKLTCGKTEIVNTTTYSGDRYSSTSSNNVTVAGKRVGACPAK